MIFKDFVDFIFDQGAKIGIKGHYLALLLAFAALYYELKNFEKFKLLPDYLKIFDIGITLSAIIVIVFVIILEIYY